MQSKILLIEDEPICALFMTRILEKFGFKSDLADTGIEGIKLFIENKGAYDFVITDIGLPDICGTQVATKIRAWEKEQAIPEEQKSIIVAVSSHMNEDIQKQCFQAGVQASYTKPVAFEELEKILRKEVQEAV
jgi:CheY-like chemotaxis protein